MLCNYFIAPFIPEIFLFAQLTNPGQSHKTTFMRAPLALIMWQLCIALAAKVLRVETDPTGTSATSPSEGRYCTLKPLGTTYIFPPPNGHLLPRDWVSLSMAD